MNKFLSISIAALATGAVLCPVTTEAENTLLTLGGAPASSMSPDGTKIVGAKTAFDDTWTFLTHKSFMWDKESGVNWLTDYDGSDCSTSGLFKAVNNSGMIAGAIKDDSMRLPVSSGGDFAPAMKVRKYADEEKGLPIFHAAVWRGSKLYVLDGGLEDISAYEDDNDGTYAIGISEDGSFVVGQSMKSYFPASIMGWQYDQASDQYMHVDFAIPEDAINSQLFGISPDGTAVYGEVLKQGQYSSIHCPAIWTSPQAYTILDLPEPDKYSMSSGLAAWSADGKKIVVYGSGYESNYMGVYDLSTGELSDIELPASIYGVTPLAITNDGDIFLSLTDTNWNEKNYYYCAATASFMTLAEYLNECAAGISNIESLASEKVKAVSGDGKTVVFTTVDYTGQASGSHVLNLDNPVVLVAAAPDNVSLYHNSPAEVTVRWEGLESVPKGLTLKGYEVFVDGKSVETKSVSEAGGEYTVTVPARIGSTHVANVRTLYAKNGEDKSSAPSKTETVYLSSNTTLLGFDNFDECELDGFGNPLYTGEDWYAENTVPNPLVVKWSLSVRDWDNNNPFAQMVNTAETPWACAYVSRFHDASDADDFFLSFYVMSKEVNSLGQNRSTDYLDVEYSTDGYEWKLLKRICAADMGHAKWNFHQIDLGKEVAGKVFQLRFNANGEGKAALLWALDCIGINDEMTAPAPEGLRVRASSDRIVELTWKNTVGAYDVSHMINSYVEADANAANEGEPIMMAVDLKPENLNAHVGEYISGVSAFLYDMPGSLNDGTRAEAVVYEDGKELARTSFEGPFETVVSSTAWLPRPVKIEAGKTYRLAVNLTRYDATYPPMYYQNVEDCIPGQTDLFSEDDGATWQSMAEVYDNMYPGEDQMTQRALGNCIWSIHADITATPEEASKTQKDSEIIGYIVYRNGEQINDMVVYSPYMRFIDREPMSKASYAVQAFYRDGRVSPLSAPFDYDASAVEEVYGDAPAVTVESGVIRVAGGYDSAMLYAIGGVKVASAKAGAPIATAHLPHGIYLLRIDNGSRVDVVKVALK